MIVLAGCSGPADADGAGSTEPAADLSAEAQTAFDTVAAASGLVMEKDSRVAAAIVRGVTYSPATSESGVKRMIRRPDLDLFR